MPNTPLFSDVRLVVTDMDGTLLDSNHQLSHDFLEVFSALRNKGIHFVAASGRQYFNLLKVFPEISHDMYFIADNGGIMVHNGETLHLQPMENKLIYEQIQIARTIRKVFPILCGRDFAYIENEEPDFIKQVNKYYSRTKVVSNLLDVKDDAFIKIALCDMIGAEKNSYPYFKHLHNTMQVKISGDSWLDLSHKNAHKGSALNKLQQLLKITPAQTMVFGDFLNDLEILQLGHFSYAMANAHEQIKAIANYSTASNNDHGVMKILRQMV